MYKPYSDATLMRMTKSELIEMVRIAEHNCKAAEETIEQQYQNTKDWRPVKHGRWVAIPSSDMVTGKAYECSECKKMRFGSFKYNYCSNCGAKMDLEVK